MGRMKWVAWALGGVVALLLVAALALRVFLPPAKVKGIALERLSSALGRQVKLGSASVSLAGVRLDELEVSQVPDFKAGTALRARYVRVSPEWLPLLLHRRLVVSRVDLAGLEATYEAKPAPAAAARERRQSRAAPAAPPATLPAVSVGRVTLKDGRFTYRAPGLEATVTHAAFDAEGVRLDRPVPLDVSFDFRVRAGKAEHAGRVSLKGSLDAAGGALAKASLSLKPLAVTVDGLALSADGKVSDLSVPSVDARLSLPRLDHAALAAVPPGFSLPALAGPLQAVDKPDGLDVSKLSLTGDGASLDLVAAQHGTRWDVARAAARWGPFAFSLSGTADTAGRGALDLKVRLEPASLAELAKLAPAAAAYKPQGTLSADAAVKGNLAVPAVSGRVTLKGAGAEAQGQRLSAVDGTLTLTEDSAAGSLAGKLNGVPFTMKLDGKDLRRAPQLRVDAHINKLDLGALPAGTTGSPKPAAAGNQALPSKAAPGVPFRLQGTFSAGALNHPNFQASASQVTVDLRGAGSDIARLDGTVALRVGAGRFEDLRSVADQKPLLKALLLPVLVLQKTAGQLKVPFLPRFDVFDFSRITGDYALGGGIVTVRRSSLEGSLASADLTGTADLVRGSLDMRAQIHSRATGTVAFKVGGTLAAPAVKLDVKSLLEQPAVKKAVDKTIQQGVDMLKGLFH